MRQYKLTDVIRSNTSKLLLTVSASGGMTPVSLNAKSSQPTVATPYCSKTTSCRTSLTLRGWQPPYVQRSRTFRLQAIPTFLAPLPESRRHLLQRTSSRWPVECVDFRPVSSATRHCKESQILDDVASGYSSRNPATRSASTTTVPELAEQ